MTTNITCVLLHEEPDRVDTCDTTYITAMIVEITGSCFSSTLSVVAALALDDVSIECSLTVFGLDPIIGDERLHIIGLLMELS